MVNKRKKGNYTRRSSRKTKTLGGEKGTNFLNEVNEVVKKFGQLELPEVGYESSIEYNDKAIEAEIKNNKTTEELLQKMKGVGQTDKCGITGTFGALKDTDCEAKKYEGYLKLKIISEKLKEASTILNERASNRYDAEKTILKAYAKKYKTNKQFRRKVIEQTTIVDSLNTLKTHSENLKTEFEGLKDHYEKKAEEKKRHIETGKSMMINNNVAEYINSIINQRMETKKREKMNMRTGIMQDKVRNTGLKTIQEGEEGEGEEGEEEEGEETGGRKTKRRRRNKRKTRRVKKH
jgi:hypothetical protein